MVVQDIILAEAGNIRDGVVFLTLVAGLESDTCIAHQIDHIRSEQFSFQERSLSSVADAEFGFTTSQRIHAVRQNPARNDLIEILSDCRYTGGRDQRKRKRDGLRR